MDGIHCCDLQRTQHTLDSVLVYLFTYVISLVGITKA